MMAYISLTGGPLGSLTLVFFLTWHVAGAVQITEHCRKCNYTETCHTDPCELKADCRNISLHSVYDLCPLRHNINILLLSHNNLTDVKGLEFNTYPDLIYLDLSFNNIDRISINATINVSKRNATIKTLLLVNNNFTSIKDFEFSQFPHLTILDLSNNVIDKMEKKSFSGMNSLEKLKLGNNFLHETSFSVDVFTDLKNLTSLSLNNNSFDVYPEEALSRLSSLEKLYIDGLNNTDFGPGFQKLTKLVQLSLSGRPYHGKCTMVVLQNSTFTNLVHLKRLDISMCAIRKVDPETFMPLKELQSLDISENYFLGLDRFAVGMYGLPSGLQILNVSNIVQEFTSCVVIKKDHFKHLSNTSITHLYIDDNEIERFELGAIPLLPQTLNFISAQRNKFSYGQYVRELHTMTNLTEVWLSGVVYPIDVPEYDPFGDTYHTCLTSQCTVEVEMDEEVDMASSEFQSRALWYEDTFTSANQYAGFSHFNLSLPRNLNIIRMNFTQMTFYIGKIQFEPNKIKHLDLSSNLLQFQEGELRGLDNVSYIDLSNNLARKMSEELFVNCEKLETLNLSFNFFGWQIQRDTNGTIFRNLTKLKKLVISNNDLKGLNGSVFKDLYALEVLNVSNNGMYNFHPRLNHMVNLTTIDCSNNQIKWLLPQTMSDIDIVLKKSPNFTLILRNNPLICECSNLHFLNWLRHSQITPPDMTGYYCLQNKIRKNIQNIDDFHNMIQQITDECRNNFGLALGCLSIFIAAMGLLVGAILYRYRWKLRYLYYAARLRYLSNTAPEEEDDSEFAFDAFVSYADEDRGFVINDMRSRLEHEASISLNIHHRDFMPGEPIVSNIVGAIKKSRKTLVLLSPNFLKSYWCRYELHMAQMESISTGRDIIIVIMYESVPAKSIPPEFLHLLQSDSYIEYPQEERDKNIFWTHLTRAVRHRSYRPGSVSSQP